MVLPYHLRPAILYYLSTPTLIDLYRFHKPHHSTFDILILLRNRCPAEAALYLFPEQELWDGNMLSQCPHLSLDSFLYYQHRDTNFDYEILSQQPHIDPALFEYMEERIGYDRDFWCDLSAHYAWDVELIERYADRIVWGELSENPYLTEAIVDKYSAKLDWSGVSIVLPLTLHRLEKYQHHLDWNALAFNEHLTLDMIERFQKMFHWNTLLMNYLRPDELISHFPDHIHLESLCKNDYLTFEVVEECLSWFPWEMWLKYLPSHILYSYYYVPYPTIPQCVCKRHPHLALFTPTFVQRFDSNINWRAVTECTYLTSELIDQYGERIDWSMLSTNRRLTLSLVQKYIHRVYLYEISTATELWRRWLGEERSATLRFIEDYKDCWNWGKLSYTILLSDWTIILEHPDWEWEWER